MNWYGMQKQNVTCGDKLWISDGNWRKPSLGVFFPLSSLAWWTGHRLCRPVYRPSSAFSLAFPTIKPLITPEFYRGALLSFDCVDSETLCQPYVFFLSLFVRLFLCTPVPLPCWGLTNSSTTTNLATPSSSKTRLASSYCDKLSRQVAV